MRNEFAAAAESVTSYPRLSLIEPPAGERPFFSRIGGVSSGAALAAGILPDFYTGPILKLHPANMIKINNFIDENLTTLRRAAGKSVSVVFEPGESAWDIEVEPDRLQKALLELIANACDTMPEGGLITIKTADVWLIGDETGANSAAKSGNYIMISVRDNGPGVPNPDLDLNDFVEQSGGYIVIDRKVGQGTHALIYLPRHILVINSLRISLLNYA